MPDRFSEAMNNRIREAARGYSVDDHDAINRSLRAAGGRAPATPPAAAPPESPELPPLGENDYTLRHTEPIEFLEGTEWDKWAHSKPVIRLLDRLGRLPAEKHYRRDETGPSLNPKFDLEAAIAHRRKRWQALAK